MDNVGKFIIGGVTIWKMIMCQSNDVVNLIRVALRQDAEISSQTEPGVIKIYKWHVSLDNKFVFLLVISATLMGTTSTVLGDINCLFWTKSTDNGTTEKPMPLHYWYPFDRNKHYVMVIVDQNIRPTLVTFCIGVVSAFVNCVTIFLRAQLRLLQYRFKNFDRSLDGGTVTAEHSLRFLCAKHQELIRYSVSQSIPSWLSSNPPPKTNYDPHIYCHWVNQTNQIKNNSFVANGQDKSGRCRPRVG
ncbi:uncharacterized protein LOC132705589 [Cylas formicarius]|uniref:uncharacterized protein LOC132705589 n=1 Tax=Cylas formicarius TaxID=197179 RepID=UPI00295898F1|nr:uncharacterized protein LOC132705589 [Cylas formicarius]